MGKAHSNAFAQVGHFYDTPFRIRRTLLCGRDARSLEAMAARWGWENTCTDWRAAVERKDIDVIDDLLTHILDTALYLNGPVSEGLALRHTFVPGRAIDDAFLAILKFANGSFGQFQATRFGIGCRNANSFQIHGSGGMLRFNLERLNHLEFADASEPATDQGTKDILVTDMKHPVFPHFWRPAHIIG